MPTPFRLIRVPEPEGEKSLWEVTEVQAWEGERQVGFLRISHIPRLRYAQRLPTRAHQLGRVLHLRSLLLPSPASMAAYRHAIFEGYQHLGYPEQAHAKSQEGVSRDEIQQAFDTMIERLWGQEQARVKAFEDFHLDRPMVDKVEVLEPGRGIGRALYLEAAKWVAEHGLQLHASEIQTDAARGVWASFQRKGLAHPTLGQRLALRLGPSSDQVASENLVAPLASRRRSSPVA